jgi:hypothetical protein
VKKWTSVIRMQKKVRAPFFLLLPHMCNRSHQCPRTPRTQILDLKTRLQEALHDNAMAAALPAGASRCNNPDWLPTVSGARHTLTGHCDAVNAVAFHPVYSALASAADDATIKSWDWESSALECTLKGHAKRVTNCEYGSKGKSLGALRARVRLVSHPLALIPRPPAVSASYDLFIKVWNVENDYHNFAMLRGHKHNVSSARFLTGDDRIVLSSRDQFVRIWEVATTCVSALLHLRTRAPFASLHAHAYAPWLRAHTPLPARPQALRPLTCTHRHCIKVIRPHSDWVRCALPNLDGKYVVTCSMDHVRPASSSPDLSADEPFACPASRPAFPPLRRPARTNNHPRRPHPHPPPDSTRRQAQHRHDQGQAAQVRQRRRGGHICPARGGPRAEGAHGSEGACVPCGCGSADVSGASGVAYGVGVRIRGRRVYMRAGALMRGGWLAGRRVRCAVIGGTRSVSRGG